MASNIFKSSNVTGLFNEIKTIATKTGEIGKKANVMEIVNDAIASQKETIGNLVRTSPEVIADVARLENWVKSIFVEAAVSSALGKIFEALESTGLVSTSDFPKGVFKGRLQDSIVDQGMTSTMWGEFMEQGIFGLSGANSSEVGDIESLVPGHVGENLELKASWLDSKKVKTGIMKAFGTYGGVKEELTDQVYLDYLATYKMLKKMSNLFIMKYSSMPEKPESIRPENATLFYKLIIERVLKNIQDKTGVIKAHWTPVKQGYADKWETSLDIEVKFASLIEINTVTNLYLSNHVFFDNGVLHGVTAREFFGTIRHMGGLQPMKIN